MKRDTLEGGHRVPFIARWPGEIPAGTISSETICLTDLLKTAAAVIGAELPQKAGEDSYNILPALRDTTGGDSIREATVYHAADGPLAIRRGDWVYIDSGDADISDEPDWFKAERGYREDSSPGELYQLASDPQKQSNIYADHPTKVAE